MLRETRTPNKALEIAINFERGIQSQLKISGAPTYTVSVQLANPTINSFQKTWNNPRTITNNFKPAICLNFGCT